MIVALSPGAMTILSLDRRAQPHGAERLEIRTDVEPVLRNGNWKGISALSTVAGTVRSVASQAMAACACPRRVQRHAIGMTWRTAGR